MAKQKKGDVARMKKEIRLRCLHKENRRRIKPTIIYQKLYTSKPVEVVMDIYCEKLFQEEIKVSGQVDILLETIKDITNMSVVL